MNRYAADLWERATDALAVAERDLTFNPDAAASRAYYAAFYAVSALFAAAEKTYAKHSAVEAAVHRDLVKSGRWSASLGEDYSTLRDLRDTGDYGGSEHVTFDEAREAVDMARRIVAAVRDSCPEIERLD